MLEWERDWEYHTTRDQLLTIEERHLALLKMVIEAQEQQATMMFWAGRLRERTTGCWTP